jgi:uncharacterized protein YkwD
VIGPAPPCLPLMRTVSATVVASLLLLAAVAINLLGVLADPVAGSEDCRGRSTPGAELAEAELAQSLTCLINDERAAAGLPPTRPDPRLRRAATRHSVAMVSGRYFAHTALDGTTFLQRVRAAGYLRRRVPRWMVGENLAWGVGQESTPESIVDSWMASPPHRRVVLTSGFRDVGIGAAQGTPVPPFSSRGITVTTEYGFRRG